MMADTRVRLRAIVPDKDVVHVKQLMGVIKGAGVETAKKLRADFQKTTRTWKHKPVFVININVDGEVLATVYTDNLIYMFVSGGTKPHIIKPRKGKFLRFGVPFQAKTRVHWIGSRNGKRGGNLVYAKGVMHPGTEAREFDEVLTDKWQPVFAALLERRINNALEVR